MKTIPVAGGYKAKVDDDMYEYLSQFKWHRVGKGKGYVGRHIIENGQSVGRKLMHHEVLPIPEGKETDHINGDIHDNRRENLRVADRSKNCANRRRFKNNTTGYKGVYHRKARGVWEAYVHVAKKAVYLGSFHDPIEAAKAYNRAAKKYHGEFARLNNLGIKTEDCDYWHKAKEL